MHVYQRAEGQILRSEMYKEKQKTPFLMNWFQFRICSQYPTPYQRGRDRTSRRQTEDRYRDREKDRQIQAGGQN